MNALLFLFPLFAPLGDGVSLADLGRFPPHALCVENTAFANAHCDWLWMQRCGWRRVRPGGPEEAYYEGWIAEATDCRDLWHWLELATDDKLSDGVRLEMLALVRQMLGRGRYCGGRMGPPVPLSYFRWRESQNAY
jgi:hypothetical protein